MLWLYHPKKEPKMCVVRSVLAFRLALFSRAIWVRLDAVCPLLIPKRSINVAVGKTMNLCTVRYRVDGVFNGNGYSDFTGWVVGDHQVDRRNALKAFMSH